VRIVVTGGAGFIGANLVGRLLADADLEVVVVDDFSTGSRRNLEGHDRALLKEGTLLDLEWLNAACEGASSIIHLGAIPSVPRSVADPLRSHHANATGTVHVLEVARRTGAHVVVASSSSVYGANPELPKHEGLVTRPKSPYAASKLATEAYALAYADVYELDVLAFRFFNVYGPLQLPNHAYAAVVPRFLSAALSGQPLPVHGDGLQTRDFTYVADVTRVLAEAAANRVASDLPVNLAFGSRTSLLELAATIEKLLNRELKLEHLDPRVGDVRDTQAGNTRLRSLFPGVEAVPLEQGVAETIAWFESEAAR
jgi:UDP-glucose 4-epimerase